MPAALSEDMSEFCEYQDASRIGNLDINSREQGSVRSER